MAKEVKKSGTNRILDLVRSVQDNMDSLYRNTYISQSNNTRDLNTLKQNIDTSIDSIINNNIESVGIPNISQLYNRINQKNSKGDNKSSSVTNEIESLFDNKNITDGLMFSFNENKYLKEYDEEIDLICKYMPKLEEALDAKKDNVLSADNFSKDFINVINTSNIKEEAAFQDRIDNIKKTYKLLDLFEDCYDNTAKYGEQFIYIVSYEKAFNRMMSVKENVLNESCIINESFSTTYKNEEQVVYNGVDLELNISGILESALNTYKSMSTVLEKTTFEKTVDDNLEFETLDTNDGFIDMDKAKKSKSKIKVPGCIVKKLKRENVIPIYIEDMCMGYYYIECEFKEIFNNNLNYMNSGNILRNGKLDANNDVNHKETAIRNLSSKLSSFIDRKFINANQDLKKEIYMILKHNEAFNNNESVKMKVTFIPVEDMVHMYFKKDQNTNRGISDLDNALLPAKLYTSLYLNNTLGILTRGHDKRVYYVKQNVDTNISKVLLNTINQIKKSNYGARELTNIKNLYNLQGSFNDFIIPVGPTGDSPINFEVMQGQDIDPKTELLEMYEEMAISSTDIPYEFIQSRHQVDYAVRLTTTNGKFLRKVFKRQAIVERIFSEIITKIYNTEYGENDTLDMILPPPAYLNIVNTNHMLQNVNDLVSQILEMEMADEEDERIRATYSKKLKHHYLSTYLDMKSINTIKDQSILEVKQKYGKDE